MKTNVNIMINKKHNDMGQRLISAHEPTEVSEKAEEVKVKKTEVCEEKLRVLTEECIWM